MFADDLITSVTALLQQCRAKGLRLATAESCTGGMIAAVLTEIAGASDVVERGFITYSDRAKVEMLGVPQAIIDRHGAVSAAVAVAMADGALKHSAADLVIAVTGIAGPGGGTPQKPVGLVYLAAQKRGAMATAQRFNFTSATRSDVRMESVREAIRLLSEAIE